MVDDSDQRRIIIDGVEYNDPQDVPEQFRELLADKDGNGVPDLIENGFQTGTTIVTSVETEFEIDGKLYTSVEEMPPEIRQMFLDKNGDGLPDMLTTPGEEPTAARQGSSRNRVDVDTPDATGIRKSIVLVLAAIALVGIIFVCLRYLEVV